MGEESPKPSSTSPGAVFLSYASEDAEAAQRIATALRAAGVEVWFDREELRGGDAWDQRIRQQILDCRLFVPIISANTETRLEGYFRREWKLATDRTESMASELAFLVPVVIDSTPNTSAHVPEKFRHVQWTRLASGEVSPAFVERVRRLLSPEALSPQAVTWVRRGSSTSSISGSPLRRSWRSSPLSWLAGVGLAMALAYIAVVSRHSIAPAPPSTPAAQQTAPRAGTAAAFNPPAHSIAVLPFVNLSGDAGQDYFSDGLTEELLNALAQINDLQVAARTSSFSFKEHPDIVTVAHKLNVAAVLEGSVRRSAHTVRVTAQLINAVTGFHLWSKTYDRDLGDVLALQTEIATAVASALKVTLVGDEAARMELGGTRDPAAFDAYLRGSRTVSSYHDVASVQSAIAAYTEAIRRDPNYALALASRSLALSGYAGSYAIGGAIREYFAKAQADARQAIKLAPELAEGHLALGLFLYSGSLDFTGASEAYERAMALAPGNAKVLGESGRFAIYMGRFDAGLTAARRAVALDPLSPHTRSHLGQALYAARRYQEAVAAFGEATSLETEYQQAYGTRGIAYYMLGDLQSARSSCETKPDHWTSHWCLALVYDRLGRHTEAEAELKKWQATRGDSAAYQYATIYAQWGNPPKALEWLATAMRVRDPGLVYLKTDPLMDPLRQDPRFQAIEQALKFPN